MTSSSSKKNNARAALLSKPGTTYYWNVRCMKNIDTYSKMKKEL
jgi:hypothetical protein